MLSSWLHVSGSALSPRTVAGMQCNVLCFHAGYGEENLGGDDLSDLRAASDGHGPFAKYN